MHKYLLYINNITKNLRPLTFEMPLAVPRRVLKLARFFIDSFAVYALEYLVFGRFSYSKPRNLAMGAGPIKKHVKMLFALTFRFVLWRNSCRKLTLGFLKPKHRAIDG